MSHYFYITPEEYKQAESNGISAKRLSQRVRQCGWSKERAMNEPVRQHKNLEKWTKLAQSNGIKYATFKARIYNGMSAEEAATEPLKSKSEVKAMAVEASRRIPAEIRALAESNGIAYGALYYRISRGMDMKVAATKSLMTRREVGKRSAKRYKDYRAGRYSTVDNKQEESEAK